MRLGGKTGTSTAVGWFTIPRPSLKVDPLQKALDEYGRNCGRERGEPYKCSRVAIVQ